VNFLMVEIPTPKPYIFMIRVNRQIKCPKSWGPGSSPSPTWSFLRITSLKPFCQFFNHFAQMFLGWSSSKVMFGMSGVQRRA
jgi:hypothetical protein